MGRWPRCAGRGRQGPRLGSQGSVGAARPALSKELGRSRAAGFTASGQSEGARGAEGKAGQGESRSGSAGLAGVVAAGGNAHQALGSRGCRDTPGLRGLREGLGPGLGALWAALSSRSAVPRFASVSEEGAALSALWMETLKCTTGAESRVLPSVFLRTPGGETACGGPGAGWEAGARQACVPSRLGSAEAAGTRVRGRSLRSRGTSVHAFLAFLCLGRCRGLASPEFLPRERCLSGRGGLLGLSSQSTRALILCFTLNSLQGALKVSDRSG